MGVYTPNLHLYSPAVDETGWGVLVNGNWSALDALFANDGKLLVGSIHASGTPSSTTFLRGDGQWVAVSGGAVASVFGRTGVVTAQSGDYAAFYAPLDSPTFTGVVTLPAAASANGLTMISDNQNVTIDAPIRFQNVANTQYITITPNGFFGPQIQFAGQTAPYTTQRFLEVGAQGLYMQNTGFVVNTGGLGTSGQVLTSLGVAGDGGPAGLAWHTLVVGDVSGAAPLASPTFTGTVTTGIAHLAGTGARGIFVNLSPGPADGIMLWSNAGNSVITVSDASGINIQAGSGTVAIEASGLLSLTSDTSGISITPNTGSNTNITNTRFVGQVLDGTNSSGSDKDLLTNVSGTSTKWNSPRTAIGYQTVRVPFTPSGAEVTNELKNIAVVFPVPFADANYTLTTDLEWDTANTPVWQANHAYISGDFIVDSNGMLQVVTNPGTSGGTVPVWNTTNGGTTTDGGAVWTLNPVSTFTFIGIAKLKTAAGFTEEVFVGIVAPMILHVTAWHD